MTDETLTIEQDATGDTKETITATETQPEKTADSGKVFTQADVDRLIKERLSRERGKTEKAAAAAKSAAEKAALEEQNKFQELYEKEKSELEKVIAENEALQLKSLRREIAAELKIPSGLAARLTGNTREEIEADAIELLAALPQALAPSLDGGAGGGKPGNPRLTDADIREQSVRLGVSFKHMKEYLESTR